MSSSFKRPDLCYELHRPLPMQLQVVFLAAKTANHPGPVLHPQRLRASGQKTAPGIFGRMAAKTVVHGVEVDVQHNLLQVAFSVNQLAAKWPLKQAAPAVRSLVERLRIGIEELRKLMRRPALLTGREFLPLTEEVVGG